MAEGFLANSVLISVEMHAMGDDNETYTLVLVLPGRLPWNGNRLSESLRVAGAVQSGALRHVA